MSAVSDRHPQLFPMTTAQIKSKRNRLNSSMKSVRVICESFVVKDALNRHRAALSESEG